MSNIGLKLVLFSFGSWIFLSVYFIKIYSDLYSVLQKTRHDTIHREKTDLNIDSFKAVRDIYLARNPPKTNQDFLYFYDYGNSSDQSNTNDTEASEGNDDKDVSKSGNTSRLDVVIFSSRGEYHSHSDTKVVTQCGNGYVVRMDVHYDCQEVSPLHDVVVFSGEIRNDRLWDSLVEQRPSEQLWLLNTDQSPTASKYFLPPPDQAGARINFSLTYHSKAEISIPHGYFVPFENVTSVRNRSFLEKHDKFSAWNSWLCPAASWNRPQFVTDMSRIIPIDVFGACGNLSCILPNEVTRRNPSPGKCRQFFQGYKFVFALEESCCSEYLTEDFWNILTISQNIPVVVGASRKDYERLAPPNSFIFAGDFNSTNQLASYLLEVASNSSLYNSFMEWRNYGSVKVTRNVERHLSDKNTICKVYDYARSLLGGDNVSAVDPYSSEWFSGCNNCSEFDIIKPYM